MYLDILIFAVIAAFLVYRLNSVLGTRNGGERERKNPYAQGQEVQQAPSNVHVLPSSRTEAPAAHALEGMAGVIDAAANVDGRIETGLGEIAAADRQFDLQEFMAGAKYAFEMIVTAYNKGDRETLKPLLSPKLYDDFSSGISAREAAGHVSEVKVHRISKAAIVEAHLGGVMAYVTVDFDVEETTVVRDTAGNVVEGNPDRVFSVEDIWTFTRDVRSDDPNWTLIETRSVEKQG